jgi:hypothetical protein
VRALGNIMAFAQLVSIQHQQMRMHQQMLDQQRQATVEYSSSHLVQPRRLRSRQM